MIQARTMLLVPDPNPTPHPSPLRWLPAPSAALLLPPLVPFSYLLPRAVCLLPFFLNAVSSQSRPASSFPPGTAPALVIAEMLCFGRLAADHPASPRSTVGRDS